MYLKKEKISIWKWIGLFFGTMMAALAEGTLDSKDKVIVGSDKTIDIGSRVRVE